MEQCFHERAPVFFGALRKKWIQRRRWGLRSFLWKLLGCIWTQKIDFPGIKSTGSSSELWAHRDCHPKTPTSCWIWIQQCYCNELVKFLSEMTRVTVLRWPPQWERVFWPPQHCNCKVWPLGNNWSLRAWCHTTPSGAGAPRSCSTEPPMGVKKTTVAGKAWM